MIVDDHDALMVLYLFDFYALLMDLYLSFTFLELMITYTFTICCTVSVDVTLITLTRIGILLRALDVSTNFSPAQGAQDLSYLPFITSLWGLKTLDNTICNKPLITPGNVIQCYKWVL